MFESITKEIRRYYVIADGERFRARTFGQAVFVGKLAVYGGLHDVRLIEEYDLFGHVAGNGWRCIDHQEFDRTSLLTASE